MTTALSDNDVMSPIAPEQQSAKGQYEREGFYVGKSPVVPADLVERVIPRMEAVMNCEYETGVPPLDRPWNPGDSKTVLRKIDNAHVSDRTILEFVSHPAIGAWAAAVTGASRVQVWATQLLYKPPASKVMGNVGWHQDYQYWQYWQPTSEVFTAWVAVGDVTEQMGPMRFVRGSQRWGLLDGGDFFGQDLDAQRNVIKKVGAGAAWEEASGVLPSGGISFHHRLTIHGSGPNMSTLPRRSFAIHMRTEKSWPVEGSTDAYVSHLNDPIACPVIYG